MIEYLEFYFPLIKPNYDKNGKNVGSKLDQLQSVQKMTKQQIPELVKLESINIDSTIQYILNIFYSLKKDTPLTYTEIKNYMDVMHIELEPEEVEVLFRIERVYDKHLR